MSEKFRKKYSLEQRLAESLRIKKKYPDRVPIIVERAKGSTVDNIDKSKFLVPGDLTMGQFIFVIRKRIKLSSDQAIFVFVNGTLPSSSALISQIYEKHKSDDNFLNFLYQNESTFG